MGDASSQELNSLSAKSKSGRTKEMLKAGRAKVAHSMMTAVQKQHSPPFPTMSQRSCSLLLRDWSASDLHDFRSDTGLTSVYNAKGSPQRTSFRRANLWPHHASPLRDTVPRKPSSALHRPIEDEIQLSPAAARCAAPRGVVCCSCALVAVSRQGSDAASLR